MKTLKFNHHSAKLILLGKKISTWRLFDDKDLGVNDQITIIDKIKNDDPSSWHAIGVATITEIVEKRLADVTEENMIGEGSFATKKEMYRTYQQYYGSKVEPSTPVKIVYFDFQEGTQGRPQTETLSEVRMYTDGGSRGNPGPSACAYVICKLDDTVVEKSGFFMGISTNNRAEYQALRLGLERTKELNIKRVDVFMDSQLVVNQMKGLYKVKNADLAPVHQEVTALCKMFDKVSFTYVPREMNKLADKEVNRILDEQKH